MRTVLLSGSSNKPLALDIAKDLGVELGKLEIEEFPNHEIRIRLLEKVKNCHVFIIQPTIHPAERYILELALIVDAAKRKGAEKITAIIPWFGYSPQDKVFREGEPLSSEVVVRMLEAIHIDNFVVLDIHSQNVLKMFDKKVENLSAMEIFVDHFRGNPLEGEWVSLALDKGALGRAKEFSSELGLPLVRFDKSRDRKTGEVTFNRLSGEVSGKNVVSFDDFVSTGGTRVKGCKFLKQEGARDYFDCVTHLIVPETTKRLENSEIDKMFITDSIRLEEKFIFDRLNVLSVAPVFVDYIKKNC